MGAPALKPGDELPPGREPPEPGLLLACGAPGHPKQNHLCWLVIASKKKTLNVVMRSGAASGPVRKDLTRNAVVFNFTRITAVAATVA